VHLFCVCTVLCVGSGLRWTDPPSKESYRLCIELRNRKSGQDKAEGVQSHSYVDSFRNETSGLMSKTSLSQSESHAKLKVNSVALVLKRIIPTERPSLVGEVSANLCGWVSCSGNKESWNRGPRITIILSVFHCNKLHSFMPNRMMMMLIAMTVKTTMIKNVATIRGLRFSVTFTYQYGRTLFGSSICRKTKRRFLVLS
jgi:hypothetical protein